MIEQTITVGNISVEIFYDQFADNPREWDNETKFIMFHRRYNLPNEAGIDHNDYASWAEMEEALQLQYKWVYPVFMYDHGGVAFSINSFECKWDSGQVGFIVLDSGNPEEAYKWATSELKTFSHYMNGETFGVSVFEDTRTQSELVTELLDTNIGYYGFDHQASGLVDDLKSYLLRVSDLSTTQQIIDQIS
jgi:hypothetical protein